MKKVDSLNMSDIVISCSNQDRTDFIKLCHT